MTSALRTGSLRNLTRLPRGVALPEDVWHQRHRWVTGTLLAHLPILVLWSFVVRVPNHSYLLLTISSGLWALARIDLVSAGRLRLSRPVASIAASAGLMSCAAYLVNISGGYIEAHFHFFVLLPVVALYEAWLPFCVAILVVLIDHGVVGTLWPHEVYGASMLHMEHPWRFAFIHAFFVAMASVGSLVTWRLAEAGRENQQHLIDELQHRATHDPLTGLGNREALAAELIATLEQRDRELAILVMDLDRFKEVNDTLGHAAGDRLLQVLSARMRRQLDGGAISSLLVRLGGDEFAVVLHDCNADQAREVALDLIEVITESVEVSGVVVSVGASIGVADTKCGTHEDGVPSDRDDTATQFARTELSSEAEPSRGQRLAQAMVSKADVAMYQAKQTGAGVAVYDPATDEHARDRLNTLSELRTALGAHDQIVLHYQPKVSLPEGRIVGVEALARWQHPTRGLLPPSEFVSLAQNTQHAQQFTRIVLETALRQAAAWRRAGRFVPIAVNVTPQCLLRPIFVSALEQMLATYRVPAELLRIEITEDAIISDPELAVDTLNQLHGLGVGTSIDDFGTGFSSLSYLRHLKVDELKIDRSFVRGLGSAPALDPRGASPDRDAGRDGADEILIASIVRLAHTLGMDVVAEGVEEPGEARILTNLGCDTAQGYLYSRPVPAKDLEPLLDRLAPVSSPSPAA